MVVFSPRVPDAYKEVGKLAKKLHRSAVTGRFVKKSTVRRSPRTTVAESAKRKKK